MPLITTTQMGIMLFSFVSLVIIYGVMHYLDPKHKYSVILTALFLSAGFIMQIKSNSLHLTSLKNDFNSGKELICHEENKALLVTNKTYTLKEQRYLFIKERGFDMLEAECESPGEAAMNPLEMLFFTLSGVFMALTLYYLRLYEKGLKKERP